jgi:SAM-dependent methyltransferase
MAERDSRDFWDREVAAPIHVTWMEPLVVRHYINESISGEIGTWPLEWFEQAFADQLPFRRGLSIGCGTGVLERHLITRGICDEVDAFDGSLASVAVARQALVAERISAVRYFVADFNLPAFPLRKYDIAFFHQSLHHVTYLERLFGALIRTIKKGGLVYLDEYVGPSRNDWSPRRIQLHRDVFEKLPREIRQAGPLEIPIQQDDPSEAVRSSEILSELSIGFSIVRKRDYGGNLLSVIYPALRCPPPAILESLIEREKIELRKPEAQSYHAVIVARRRGWISNLLATARYRVAETLRRKRLAALVHGDVPHVEQVGDR